MPCRPTSCSASFTSSSLNGLMTASIFFMRAQNPADRASYVWLPGVAQDGTAAPQVCTRRAKEEGFTRRLARAVPTGLDVDRASLRAPNCPYFGHLAAPSVAAI